MTLQDLDLQNCFKLVWDFRNEYGEYWPTPDRMDSLRYAYTEAGEALSDWLRENRKGHKRNHQRDTNVLGELADCAIMLLTAWGDYGGSPNELYMSEVDMDDICVVVGECLNHTDGGFAQYYRMQEALSLIVKYFGNASLAYHIRGRLDAIYYKHVEPHGPDQA